jgi:small conductance mechanosensitive channel
MDKIDTNLLMELAIKYGVNIGTAILILVIGWIAIKYLIKIIHKIMDKREVDPSVIGFTLPLIRIGLKIILIITVIQRLGVETTSFLAVLGTAGLAIGLALQGTLSNFAGGVIILVLKPFRVGDFIEAQGYTGTVHTIKLFTTILKTVDNKTVIIPNGALANGNILNFTHEPTRRVDWIFSIGYGNDVNSAFAIIKELIADDKRIFSEPAPFVALHAMADSSVNLVVRVWANTEDYWDIFFDMNKRVYERFPEEGLSVPFPQMDIHLHKIIPEKPKTS